MDDQKHKILIITSEFPPLPGGIGNHAFFLADYLCKMGYEISVVSDFRSPKSDKEFDKKQSFSIFRIKRNKFTSWNRVVESFFLARNTTTIICSGKFSLWIGGFLSLILKKNYIAVLHGSEINAGGKISKWLTHWSLKRFAKIIAVSNFTKEIALKINSKLKIEVINNGFKLFDERLNAVKKTIGNPKIVTVGNVTYRKGQQNVIAVLPFLKEIFPEIHYHCIGIPTEKEAFSALAKSLDVQDNITFHGALSAVDLVAILKESAVFFMLSDVLNNGDFEGFGIALLEANALGLPAIGSNNSGIVDAIKSGFSGEVVNPKSQEEIVIAFQKIMTHYDEYSKNALIWSSNFTWDKIGKKYCDFLSK